MYAREVQRAAALLAAQRRRAFEAVGLAGGVGVLAVLASLFLPALLPALVAGAAAEALIALVAFSRRRGRIARLALDPVAYEIPEVERFGSRLTRPSERKKLARSIRSFLDEPHSVGAVYLPDRVAAYADELDALSRDLLSPADVEPASMVACLRLLTEGAESPLYNPKLPAPELGAALRRIRSGIRRTESDRVSRAA